MKTCPLGSPSSRTGASPRDRIASCGVSLLVLCACVLLSGWARADVRREGTWPANDKAVSLDLQGVSRGEAIKKLATAAGWNVVVNLPTGEPVDIHVTDQPASKVLELLLDGTDVVAKRSGSLVSIAVDTSPRALTPSSPVPPVPATPSDLQPPPVVVQPRSSFPAIPPLPPASAMAKIGRSKGNRHARGADKTITGGSFRVEKDEVVGDVTILGGSVEVLGTVSGDIAVMGGTVKIRSGGHVSGDATAIGGSLNVEDGARIDGDVGVLGGVLKKGDHVEIGGSISHLQDGEEETNEDDSDSEEAHHEHAPKQVESKLSGPKKVAHALTESLSHAACFFLIGAIAIALGGKRMDLLRAEVAAKPMRSLALGVVGSVGWAVFILLMCVTIIGIPVAIVGIFLSVLVLMAAIAAVLTTAGQALLGHRTSNPYMHLALGCALFTLIGAIPVVGGLMVLAVVAVAVGVLFATRCGGLIPPRHNGAGQEGPYRTAATL